jgi:hypothetical protein
MLFTSPIHIQEREECNCFLNVKGFSYFACSGLALSDTDDTWHFEVKGSPSIALELAF